MISRIRRRLGRWRRHLQLLGRRRAFSAEVRRLADALRGTPLDGHYWVVGGLLLGWARQGRPLDSDLDDADFAYLDADHERFVASIPALVSAGFAPRHRFASVDGRTVEHRFRRNGVNVEFFRLTPVGDRWQYSMFGSGDAPDELIAHVPAQPRVSFRYLGRDWRKVLDHDLALRTIYGDWRTDRPDWSYTLDHAIVRRIANPGASQEWRWPEDAEDHAAGVVS